MSLDEDVAQLTIDDVLTAVCAPEASSGAGVAAALTLALAAACARKAVGVTLKRAEAGTDRSALDSTDERLQLHQHRAVAQARRDALLFRAFLQTREPRQAQNLVESAQHFQMLVGAVGDELDGLRDRVATVVVGDVDAAKALHRAASEVSAGLLREARGERNRLIS